MNNETYTVCSAYLMRVKNWILNSSFYINQKHPKSANSIKFRFLLKLRLSNPKNIVEKSEIYSAFKKSHIAKKKSLPNQKANTVWHHHLWKNILTEIICVTSNFTFKRIFLKRVCSLKPERSSMRKKEVVTCKSLDIKKHLSTFYWIFVFERIFSI